MGPLDLFNHLFGFLAPALAVGVVLALAGYFFNRKVAVARGLTAQAAINCVAGVLALLVGLWFFQRDGKVASYAAMVLACASTQWWGLRGWR